MKYYGILLEDLTFKKGTTPDDFIDYFSDHEVDMPNQAEASTDSFNDNPYFAIAPVFTRNACDFESTKEIDQFLIQTIKPFVDMDEKEIQENISIFFLTTD